MNNNNVLNRITYTTYSPYYRALEERTADVYYRRRLTYRGALRVLKTSLREIGITPPSDLTVVSIDTFITN